MECNERPFGDKGPFGNKRGNGTAPIDVAEIEYKTTVKLEQKSG